VSSSVCSGSRKQQCMRERRGSRSKRSV
jgi:hypothetical protein